MVAFYGVAWYCPVYHAVAWHWSLYHMVLHDIVWCCSEKLKKKKVGCCLIWHNATLRVYHVVLDPVVKCLNFASTIHCRGERERLFGSREREIENHIPVLREGNGN